MVYGARVPVVLGVTSTSSRPGAYDAGGTLASPSSSRVPTPSYSTTWLTVGAAQRRCMRLILPRSLPRPLQRPACLPAFRADGDRL
jgi:hypothetical protein